MSLLLRAMAVVQSHMRNCTLVVAGDGPQRAMLEREARRLPGDVRFTGRQTAAEIAAHMAESKVFCGPSIRAESGDAEGFGMVFAEAQACGLPVVSFAHGGIPEAVRDGETGLLAPEGDWQQLAEHLLALLTEPELWHRCSAAGPRWVQEQFDVQRQTWELERLYDDVLAE